MTATSFKNEPRTPSDGPTLETYVETRFNLLIEFINEKFSAQDVAMRASIETGRVAMEALEKTIQAAQLASDIRYQQRFEAQSDALAAAFQSQQQAMQTAFTVAEKAVQAALAAADRAVSKAELASDKRFESVNEFRKTLDDQQRTLMPREEVNVIIRGQSERISLLKEQLDHIVWEKLGIKGGWGYAVGVIGFVATLLALVGLAMAWLRR